MSPASAIAILLLAASCDGSVGERGTVVDATTHQPIAGAQVWFADREMDQGLASYLDGKGTRIGPFQAVTDEHGAFSVNERLAGPGTHDLWLVVRATGHVEVRRQIWKGTGFKTDLTPIEIALEPAK